MDKGAPHQRDFGCMVGKAVGGGAGSFFLCSNPRSPVKSATWVIEMLPVSLFKNGWFPKHCLPRVLYPENWGTLDNSLG